jgi:glycyl-tRNA synthetase
LFLAFEETLLKKMFVVPSFEIHGGVKGLFDLGPSGCALKSNIVDIWKKHFILEENMLEVSSSPYHNFTHDMMC